MTIFLLKSISTPLIPIPPHDSPPTLRREKIQKRLRALITKLNAEALVASRTDAVPGALSSRIIHTKRKGAIGGKRTPHERMQQCRDALGVLDKKGWNRSFHQRLFHEDFLVSIPHHQIVLRLKRTR